MKNLFQFPNGLLFFSLILIMFSSCAPRFYAPSTQLQTDLQEKNDLHINCAAAITEDFAISPDFSIAYAPTSKLGIALSRTSFIDRFGITEGFLPIYTNKHKTKYELYNLGLGYYNKFHDNWHTEVFMIYGKGNIKTSSDQPNPNLNAKADKIGLQCNLSYLGEDFNIGFPGLFLGQGLQADKFSISLLNNISQLSFSDIEGSIFDSSDLNLKSNNSNLIFESAIALGLEMDFYKLIYQVGMSHNLSNKTFMQKRAFISVGLQIKLDELFEFR